MIAANVCSFCYMRSPVLVVDGPRYGTRVVAICDHCLGSWVDIVRDKLGADWKAKPETTQQEP